MRTKSLLLATLLCARVALAGPPRVAILPLEPDPGQQPVGDLKEGGAAIADDMGMRLHDFPDVDWVERAKLNELLEEADFDLRAGDRASSIAMGRLLKADYIIRGNIHSTSETQVGINVEVVDLTNADVFSDGKSIQWNVTNPGRFSVDEEVLAKITQSARRLLNEAVDATRTSANKITLAPILVANLSSNDRLAGWQDQLMRDIEETATARGGFRLLHFAGAAEAAKEQQLALLGLTDADPLAWRHAAQAYIWGDYEELPTDANTAFDEIKVRVDIHLWVGEKPMVFTRTVAVKDLDAASRAMSRDVVDAAARSPHIPLGQEAATRVSDEIYRHICSVVHSGIFSDDAALAAVPPDASIFQFSNITFDTLGGEPEEESEVTFIRTMLGLACFFDPQNPRKQLIRLMFNDAELSSLRSEAIRAEPEILNEILDDFGQLEHQAHPSETISHVTMDCLFEQLIVSTDLLHEDADGWGQLFGRFKPYMFGYPVAMLRRHPGDEPYSNIADGWLYDVLNSSLKPELRLDFLRAIWPLLNQHTRDSDLVVCAGESTPKGRAAEFDRLMADLGDRKSVQEVLVSGNRPAAVKPAEPSDDADDEPMDPNEAISNIIATSEFPYRNNNPLMKGVTAVPESSFRSLPGDSSCSVMSLHGFGDQLLIDCIQNCQESMENRRAMDENPVPPASSNNALTGVVNNYRLSTQTCEPVSDETVMVANGRRFNFEGDALDWTDMLSGESGQFTIAQGAPGVNDGSVGSAGARYTVVAGRGGKNNDRIVGFYDWITHKWLTPPPPPQDRSDDDDDDDDQAWGMGPDDRIPHIVGDDDWIIFVEWSLAYHISTHTWIDASKALNLPFQDPAGKSESNDEDISLAYGVCIDGEFWLWGDAGIVQYSPAANRVLWSSRTNSLFRAIADGQYLWLLFAPRNNIEMMRIWSRTPMISESMVRSEAGMHSELVLFDRTTCQAVGAMDIHRIVTSCYATADNLYLGCLQSSSTESDALLCAGKKELCAAMSCGTPVSDIPPSRPAWYESGASALDEAILRQDVSAAKKLLDGGVSASALFGPCHTPAVTVAAWTGNKSMVQLLLDHGADVNVSGGRFQKVEGPDFDDDNRPPSPPVFKETGWTALTIAASRGDPGLVKLLLKAGAKPMPPGAEISPLAVAVAAQNTDVAELLVKAGAPIITQDAGGAITGGDVVATIEKNNDAETAARLLGLQPSLPEAARATLERIAQPDELTPAERAAAGDIQQLSSMLRDAIGRKYKGRATALARLIPQSQGNNMDIENDFADAINADLPDVVSAMLDAGMDPNESPGYPGYDSFRWLMVALSAGKPDMMQLLLDHGANPRLWDGQAGNIFQMAASQLDSAPLAERLVAYYPDLNARYGYGTLGGAILGAASEAGAVKTANLLLRQGVPASARDRDGCPALVRAGTLEMRCLLAGAGADIHACDLAGDGVAAGFRLLPQWHAVALRKFVPASDMERKGRDILLTADENTPSFRELFDAVRSNETAKVRALLDRGAPVYVHDDEEPIPGLVLLAADAGNMEIARLLIQHGCNPCIGLWEGGHAVEEIIAELTPSFTQNDDYRTPLIAAAEKGDTAMVNLLLDAGAYVPVRDEYRRTAIDAAATPELAALIKEKSRLQFIADKFFSEPYGHFDSNALRMALLQAPALAGIRNPQGITLFQQLTRYNEDLPTNDEAVAVFHECGVDPDMLDTSGMTLLDRAVLIADAHQVSVLMSDGCNPLAPDSRGISALDLARGILDKTQRSKIIALLDGQRGHPN